MTDRFLQDVITNLKFHAAWVEIGEYFLRMRPKGKETPFIRRMLDTEQDIITRLSRTLRQHDYAPAHIRPDGKLIDQAKKRQTAEAVLRYLHHGILMSLEWYQDRLKNPHHPFTELWRELFDLEDNLRQDVEHVLNR